MKLDCFDLLMSVRRLALALVTVGALAVVALRGAEWLAGVENEVAKPLSTSPNAPSEPSAEWPPATGFGATSPEHAAATKDPAAAPAVSDELVIENLTDFASRAEGGDLQAALQLSRISLKCLVMEQPPYCAAFLASVNESRALAWIDRAAASGSVDAQVYFMDVGLRSLSKDAPDHAARKREIARKSVDYLGRAANRGNSLAMFKLGQVLASGRLVNRDPENAYRYSLAGAMGVPGREGMDPVQIEQELRWLADLRAEVDPALISRIRQSAREMARCCQ